MYAQTVKNLKSLKNINRNFFKEKVVLKQKII